MNVNELSPGIYKIREKEMLGVYGNKLGRPFDTSVVHLLRVIGVGQKCRYFIDQNMFGEHPHCMNFERDYEVVSKYVGTPEVHKARITISFSDGQGGYFEFTVSDVWILRDLFEEMPWLKKPFGYEPRRKTISKALSNPRHS